MYIDNKARTAYIKERVTMPDVIARYYRTGRHPGRTACPFHGGEHDNLGYNQRTYHCFVCGEKGDVITFTQRINGIDFPAALRLLDADFALGIERFSKAEQAVLVHAQRQREAEAERPRAEAARTRRIFVLFTRIMRWIRGRKMQTPVHAEQLAFLDRQTDFLMSGGKYTSDPRAAARAVVQRVREAEHGI